MYQVRNNGACEEYQDLLYALSQHYEKVSWTEGDARVILWADGRWEVRTSAGHWTGRKFTKWVEED